MAFQLLLCLTWLSLILAQEPPIGIAAEHNHVESPGDSFNETELILAFVTFRHGDRTPDQEELDVFPSAINNEKNIFFPYGKKSLTNRGKQRGFLVGKYLRERYDGFLSKLYLADEVSVRTTDFSRTKMTALTALAALYPPPPSQRWNPNLDWQPVPYNYGPSDEDDLNYWYNCPRYIYARDKVYELPEVRDKIESYEELFQYLSEQTKTNITTPEQVFFLDNLFQTLNNVGIRPPKWAQDIMPQIKEVTKLEYACEFYNDEVIRLSCGTIMTEIINATNEVMKGNVVEPKMRIYSAHENNVAAIMAASRVFDPHQPEYGSTFSLEFRRNRNTGVYGFVAVYAAEAGGPAKILPMTGCGGHAFCDYETFLSLIHDILWSKEDFHKECSLTS